MRSSNSPNPILFVLFFISGFCALVYQTIWLRLAFASFGIVTPVISIIVSVFMLGLSLGSWLGGKYIEEIADKTHLSPLVFYAAAEAVVALSALVVPLAFKSSANALLQAGSLDSINYLVSSALLIGISILPWCICMGTTFPFAMAFVRRTERVNSFSYLYLANVIGSAFGALLTASILIELFGFAGTLWITAGGNIFIALIALILGFSRTRASLPADESESESETGEARKPSALSDQALHAILFITGFTSMAMEVVWVRAFSPVLGHAVYAFATLIFVYLWSTGLGAYNYRVHLKFSRVRAITLSLSLLGVFSFFPVLLGDPRLHNFIAPNDPTAALEGVFALFSIAPFCFVLGYLTPQIVDEYSGGVPRRAGLAYAINIIGCILGPLLAGYLLLPLLGAKISLILLAVPFLLLSFWAQPGDIARKPLNAWRAAAVGMLVGSFFCTSYEEGFGKGEGVIRRDHVATVLQTGSGKDKHLYVNGIQMTALDPVTKELAHIPLLLHQGEVKRCLGICFGMGTSFRSQMSWGVDTTWVELVPSVKAAFSYYHDDAAQLANSAHGRIIVDDGRRFLQRTQDKFDIITVDAPPPPEAAGVGLLFSDEFYKLAKTRLQPGGIVESLIPVGDPERVQAELRSFIESFPYVRIFLSKEIGYICAGSMTPMKPCNVDDFVSRMPAPAERDLLEWRSDRDEPRALEKYLTEICARELQPAAVLKSDSKLRITDDRPFNEYFMLRAFLTGNEER